MISLLGISGQRTSALEQFEACKRILKAELDVEPADRTTQLYESIRDGKIAEKLTMKLRHNLPAQLTSFIGRKREIEQVISLIRSHRLVTLTGAGGIGKSRLGLKVAEGSLDDFPDGVWLAELAPLVDPAIVAPTVANAVGLQLTSGPQAVTFLKEYLQDRQLLLLLDNCEHVIKACAQLAEVLLRYCSALHILTTSRENLGIEGEVICLVPPLSLPDAQHNASLVSLDQYEAIQLFFERAGSVSSTYQLTQDASPAVGQICQRLDGIPLAIELAAARVKVLRVEEIAHRLNDRLNLLVGGSRTSLPRYQTLRASLE